MECASRGQQREIEKGQEEDKEVSDSKRANVRCSLHLPYGSVTDCGTKTIRVVLRVGLVERSWGLYHERGSSSGGQECAR